MGLNLRIVTINIHKGFSWFNTRFVLHQVREAIRDTKADIVFLQEVVGEHTSKAEKHENWPKEPHYEFLADTIWSDYAYGKNAVYPKGHHGNATLSKFPIKSLDHQDISTNRVEDRGFLMCEIEIPETGQSIYTICVHLGLWSMSRRKQMKAIKKYVEEKIPKNAPLIIAGDFNDWRLSAPKILAEPIGLKDVFRVFEGKMVRTFPAKFPLLKLDRIYTRGFSVSQADVCRDEHWKKLSDHLGLFTEITLNL